MRSHRLAAPGLAFVLGAAGVLAIGGAALAVSPNAPAAPAVAAGANICGTNPLDVEIVLDTSGSMSSNSSGSPAHTRLYWAQAAATQLVSDLDSHGGVGTLHHVGLTTFSGTTASVKLALGTSTAAQVDTAISALTASSNTPFKTGMAAGAADLTAHGRTVDNITHVIIFLSDGRPNPDGPTSGWGNGTSQRPTLADANAFKGAADEVISIAIGQGGTGSSQVDLALMQNLAKPNDASHSFNVVDSSLLPTLFKSIFTEIACPAPDVTSTLHSGDISGAKISVLDGAKVTDQAVLSGAKDGFGGTVTYTVYSDDQCTVVFADAGTKTVTDGIAPASDEITFPAAGNYHWRIHYSPDSSHSSADSACDAEVLTVTEEPGTPKPTDPPTASPTNAPTASPTTAPTTAPTPVQSVEGATATPTKAPTAVPSQGVAGVTSVPSATAPATTTGNNSGGGSGSPLFALLVALLFGGLGVFAVEAQRRSVRR
jgi:hypothetical protein